MYFSTSTVDTAKSFGLVIKYSSASEGDCIQIGGFNENCKHLYTWPESWQSSEDGTYSGIIDVSEAAYAWPDGNYTVRANMFSIIFLF